MSNQLELLASKAIQQAKDEIVKFSLPHPIAYDLSIEKGRSLAARLNADVYLVEIGISMMDIKLGQAFSEKRINDHIKMSVKEAEQFINENSIAKSYADIIINSVEAHHGDVKFNSIESEICANADCYRFIHPKGVFLYLTILGRRFDDFAACLNQVEVKLDEKMNIVTLPSVLSELQPIYKQLKEWISLSKP